MPVDAIPGGCPAELVKVDFEPLVDALVYGVISVTDLLTRGTLL